jgi:hypothetical protein
VDVDFRLGRIADKLAAIRAGDLLPDVFGADRHRFVLGPPLPEAVVAGFEERHGVDLPLPYRRFITELGDGGAGPGTGLNPLPRACGGPCRPGHLSAPSPFLLGARYTEHWGRVYDEPPGSGRTNLRGTLTVAAHGCAILTNLIVTGPARGRLFVLHGDGDLGPDVLDELDFLTWYERWVDGISRGAGEQYTGGLLPFDEPELRTLLVGHPSPLRRSQAGVSLLLLPQMSDAAWTVLSEAASTDDDPLVRAELLTALALQRADLARRPSGQAFTEAADHARRCDPPAIAALALLDALTWEDLLPELTSPDPWRRREAVWHLVRDAGPINVINEVILGLLADTDPVMRCTGIAAVQRLGLTHLHPDVQQLVHDNNGWVRYDAQNTLDNEPWASWTALEAALAEQHRPRSAG